MKEAETWDQSTGEQVTGSTSIPYNGAVVRGAGLRAFYSYFKLASQTAVRRVSGCTVGGSACSDYANLLCLPLSLNSPLKSCPSGMLLFALVSDEVHTRHNE
jgi:hypothetical protein